MGNKRDEKRAFLSDAIIFDVIIMLFFLLLAIMSLNYNPRARSIPLGLGIVGAAMMFLQFLVDALPRVRSKLRFVSQSGILAGESQFQPKGLGTPGVEAVTVPDQTVLSPQEEMKSKAVEWWRLFRVILWLVGFIVLLSFTNYLVAVGAFVVLATRLEARETWKRSMLLGICVNVGFYILFEVILEAQF
ncbi:MAG: tripartite tricarboxylate transporter TctB family protein [Deltaproteobacteria bacterium]|nr:MAG: tripartite tricarboxylate transporter TctB family protein [Deltaproteobacteria bacterium]